MMINLRNLSALGAAVVVAGFAMPVMAQGTTTPTQGQPITDPTGPSPAIDPTGPSPAIDPTAPGTVDPTGPGQDKPTVDPTAPSQRTSRTKILPQETVSGVSELELPTPPVQPFFYTLPNDIRIAKDSSVTTNTPITDARGKDLAAWSESVRTCLRQSPVMVRVVGEEQVPFVINNTEGTLKLNANDKPVCPNS